MDNKIEDFIKKCNNDELERFKRMCWEDRTTFDAINIQFNLSPNEAVKVMRKILSPKDFTRWRKRANNQGHLKHEKTRPKEVNRFKCSRERLDGSTKGHK